MSTIDSAMQDKGLSDLFTEIVTNPAEWDDSGLLKLCRRVDPAGVQHKCAVGCSPNMCKGAPAFPTVRSLWLKQLQAKNLRPSWNVINPTLIKSFMSGMEVTIIAPSYVLEGRLDGSQLVLPTHERFLAKIRFSADVAKGWRIESRKKAPKMDSNVRFTNGPELGRSKNISIPCGLRSICHRCRIEVDLAGVRPLGKAHVRSSY